MFINPKRSSLSLKFGVRRLSKYFLSWSESSLGVDFLFDL